MRGVRATIGYGYKSVYLWTLTSVWTKIFRRTIKDLYSLPSILPQLVLHGMHTTELYSGSHKDKQHRQLLQMKNLKFLSFNPILHTWIWDSCFTCDGSSTWLKFSQNQDKILGRYAKNWIFQQNNILPYFFSKPVHGCLTTRCVK